MSDGIADRQVVGIDLHLHRSVSAEIDERGNEMGWVRIENDPKTLVAQCRKAGRGYTRWRPSVPASLLLWQRPTSCTGAGL